MTLFYPFLQTKKKGRCQNNSSQSKNRPSQHVRAAVTSSSSSCTTRDPLSPPAAFLVPRTQAIDRSKLHFPPRYAGMKQCPPTRLVTKSSLTPFHGRVAGTGDYETLKTPPSEPNSPKDLDPENHSLQNETPAYIAPRVPSAAKPQLKSSIRVPHAPTPVGLPQSATAESLPPQPPTPGRLPPQPPTPEWLPSQPPTSPDIPPQPPFTPNLGSETRLPSAKRLPLPPSQPPQRPDRHVINSEAGTATIAIVFPSDQVNLRNASQTPFRARPVTQAILEINKKIEIKLKMRV